jgi:hypothetical protein
VWILDCTIEENAFVTKRVSPPPIPTLLARRAVEIVGFELIHHESSNSPTALSDEVNEQDHRQISYRGDR